MLIRKFSILILTGGDNDELKISLLSAENVRESLDRQGYKVELHRLKTKADVKVIKKANIVFPIIHGKDGEAGKLQEQLENLNARFVGAGSKACKAGWDKVNFKKFCLKNGILTPSFQVLKSSKDNLIIPYPFVIKPSDNGSSVDVYIVKNSHDLEGINLNKLFVKYDSLLVEEYIDGVEVTVGILNEKALPIIEIVPPKGETFDFQNKYNGKTKEIPFAPSLNALKQKEIQNIALTIHKRLGYKNLSR